MSAVKLNTASGGSISLAPTNTASNLTISVPALAGSFVTADSTGNVGIGVSTSSSRLTLQDLTGTADKALCDFVAQNSSGVSYFNYDFYGTSGSSGFLRFRKARGSPSAPTIIGDEPIARIGGMSYDGAKFLDAAMIRFASDGAPALNSSPGRIEFWTTPNGSAGGLSRCMTIGNGGNVAIGDTDTSGRRLKSTISGATCAISATNNADGNWQTAQLIVETNGSTGNAFIAFHVAGAAAPQLRVERGAGEQIDSINGNQTAFATFRASAFNVSSDYRLKENITPITDALDRLMLLKPCRFNFIEGSMLYRNGATVDGFIAHEVTPVVPEAVTGEKDAVMPDGKILPQSLDQAKIVPLLTAAIQEQQAIIEQLKSRIEALEQA